jgi:hypothetical protein
VSDLDSNFALLLGRQPTDRERQQLYRVRDALKLRSTDSVWLLLMVLGHYETLYEKFPGLIASAAKEAVTSVRETATAQAAIAAVHRAAVEAAKQAAKAQRWKWVAVCGFLFCLGLGGTGALGFSHGQQTGFANGVATAYQRCRNEATAASWANTPDGQLAHGLAVAGSLRQVATCQGQTWAVENGICMPYSDKGKVQGWRVDPNAAERAEAQSAIEPEPRPAPKRRRVQ